MVPAPDKPGRAVDDSESHAASISLPMPPSSSAFSASTFSSHKASASGDDVMGDGTAGLNAGAAASSGGQHRPPATEAATGKVQSLVAHFDATESAGHSPCESAAEATSYSSAPNFWSDARTTARNRPNVSFGRDDLPPHCSDTAPEPPQSSARFPSATGITRGTATATITSATPLVRPKPQSHSQTESQQRPRTTSLSSGFDPPTQPTIVRRVSNASVTIRHPAPDLSSRPSTSLGNIAALEATAEQFSKTDSIDNAIRDAHEKLKRSDSRRSSVLRASRIGSSSEAAPNQSALSRQSSVAGSSHAHSGGYSPSRHVLSPSHSLSNVSAAARLRSTSMASLMSASASAANTASSIGMTTDLAAGQPAPLPPMSRHAPGRSSVRSAASVKPSLGGIAEMEPPVTLTQDALDEADRVVAETEADEDAETTIRGTAHHYDPTSYPTTNIADPRHPAPAPPQAALWSDDMSRIDGGYGALPSPNRLQVHQPDSYVHYSNYEFSSHEQRPATAASFATSEQEHAAFGDFDGVHCDPEFVDFPDPPPGQEQDYPLPEPQRVPRPRPSSYLDPETGQQMLYYPARVPAMLNLPPKLSSSTKPAAAQNRVRSQVLGAMPKETRQSRSWLPDPLQGLGDSLDDDLGGNAHGLHGPGDMPAPGSAPEAGQWDAAHSRQPSETGTVVPPAASHGQQDTQRQTDLTDTDRTRRGSRMPGATTATADKIPPHLRASVFFDLPPESPPVVQVKDGSATATLESILDASATAPVSAFTDHAFAGKLGSEVYGRQKIKKKNREMAAADHKRSGSTAALSLTGPAPGSSPGLGPAPGPAPKKRSSFMSLMTIGRHNEHDASLSAPATDDHTGSTTPHGTSPQPGHSLTSSSTFPDREHGENGGFGSETGDQESESDEEEDEDEQYQGPPTTLLAELQIRKQQQKQRTRPIHEAYPNGLHSTLLELDAVAEVERKARREKKINLAWEDPSANGGAGGGGADDDEEEDIPLAMLFAAKNAVPGVNGGNRATMDIGALMGEVNRPLGLMERRDLEENEPLSRRRERLHGREGGRTLNALQKRASVMALTPGDADPRSQSRLTLALPQQQLRESKSVPGEGDDPEVEGETLAERKRRLAAETLPRTYSTAGSFSAELLSQFENHREDKSAAGNSADAKAASRNKTDGDKAVADGPSNVPEEEETLGQRRRRLQAEREAREREMGLGGSADGSGSGGGANGNGLARPGNRLSHRFSMADVLGSHPREGPQGVMDPREQERQRREAEAARVRREQDAKMAALRAQMPQSLTGPSIGATTGGFLGGRFNDGLGGGLGAPRRQSFAPSGRGIGFVPQHRTSAYGVGDGMYGGGPVMNSPAALYGAGASNPTFAAGAGAIMPANPPPYNTFGPVPAPQGQLDMVERWRQGVTP